MVLAWCESSRGIAQLTRILTQLCAANRGDGGGVVVVLCQHVSCGRQGLCCPAQYSAVAACACDTFECCWLNTHSVLAILPMQRGKLEMEELLAMLLGCCNLKQ